MKPSLLQLDQARALLDRAGVELPLPSEGADTAYVQRVVDALCDLSLKDPLTGLANRRLFFSVLEQEIDRVARAGEMALLLMVDIDHFKQVNDTHGHVAGDRVIQAVANALLSCVRPMDTVARYGGEEFAVILPNCQPTFGAMVAERIRRTIELTPVDVGTGPLLYVTASCGGAYAPRWIRETSVGWTARADDQLYQAKREGRNRVCLQTPLESLVSAEEKSLLFGYTSDEDLPQTSAQAPS